MSVKRLALACVVAGFTACGGDSGTEALTPTSLTVTPGAVPLTSINQTQQLSVAVKDQNGATMSGFTPTYASNATAVATVSTSGLVRAVGNGSATITVSAAGFSQLVAVTVTQAPAALTKLGGDAQAGVESTALPNPLRVKVADALGNGIAGITVTFTVAGGGTLNDSSVTTGGTGEAQVTWTLGAAGQAQSVTAAATGLAAVVFTATASSAAAMTIQKFVGDGQTALVGNPTNTRPAVRVTNAAAQPVQGVNVTFAVTGGGGSIGGSTTIATNANGVAQVQNWVVGASAGANAMTATGSGTFTGSPTVTFTATAATKQYNIVIRNVGPALSPELSAALVAAEAYWEQTIYGDLSNVAINTTDACGLGVTISETVDDLIILARFDAIDGPRGILGRAGACSIRVSNGLPIYGLMEFDSADVTLMTTEGTLNSVMLHEMGHVIGFSDGIWNSQPGITTPVTCAANVPRDTAGAGTAGLDSHFTCAGARAAFDSIGGGSFTGGSKVPLENCIGVTPCSLTGTIYAHWRETTFDEELMTGYVCGGGSCPLSTVTIASFGDIGYLVNYAAAQAYSQVFSVRAQASGTRVPFGDDLLRLPLSVIDDASGRVLRVIQP